MVLLRVFMLEEGVGPRGPEYLVWAAPLSDARPKKAAVFTYNSRPQAFIRNFFDEGGGASRLYGTKKWS